MLKENDWPGVSVCPNNMDFLYLKVPESEFSCIFSPTALSAYVTICYGYFCPKRQDEAKSMLT